MVASMLNSTVSAEQLILLAIAVGISLTIGYFLFFAADRKLPPMSKAGMLENVKRLMVGKDAPQFLVSQMRELGPVFRLSMPETEQWVTVCDPALARQILLEEDEKPPLYKRFNAFSMGAESLFTRNTHGGFWHTARKGVASSFSSVNVCTSMPKMYEKINDLREVLHNCVKEASILQVSEITTRLAMDFISAGQTAYNTVALFQNDS